MFLKKSAGTICEMDEQPILYFKLRILVCFVPSHDLVLVKDAMKMVFLYSNPMRRKWDVLLSLTTIQKMKEKICNGSKGTLLQVLPIRECSLNEQIISLKNYGIVEIQASTHLASDLRQCWWTLFFYAPSRM